MGLHCGTCGNSDERKGGGMLSLENSRKSEAVCRLVRLLCLHERRCPRSVHVQKDNSSASARLQRTTPVPPAPSISTPLPPTTDPILQIYRSCNNTPSTHPAFTLRTVWIFVSVHRSPNRRYLQYNMSSVDERYYKNRRNILDDLLSFCNIE